MLVIEIIKAFIYGVLEGITEWLPVSSTGHLILLEEILPLGVGTELGAEFEKEFSSIFEVVIQLGAIMAVVVTFFSRLNPFAPSKSSEQKKATWTLWFKIALASVPAAIIGIIGDKLLEVFTGKNIDSWLFNWYTVAVTLIAYGILFIIVERWQRGKVASVCSVDDISFSQAAVIGCFQALSMVPGTSRSGATILGARTIGISRSAAAEFSLFMGIPAMFGGSFIKGIRFVDYVAESGVSIPPIAFVSLATASIVAFAVSMVAIRFLMEFVKKHSFAPFGVYRIALGVLVILYFTVFA